MRSRYTIVKMFEEGMYFMTSTIIEWLPVFTKKAYFDILVDSLVYSRKEKKLKIFSYVIMDNHFHIIASAKNLQKIIKEIKSFTAQRIIEKARGDDKKWLLDLFVVNKKTYKKDSLHQVWQEGYHPQLITNEDVFRQKANYIHYNPVRRGLVEEPEDWLYSSAKNYKYDNKKGLFEIDLL